MRLGTGPPGGLIGVGGRAVSVHGGRPPVVRILVLSKVGGVLVTEQRAPVQLVDDGTRESSELVHVARDRVERPAHQVARATPDTHVVPIPSDVDPDGSKRVDRLREGIRFGPVLVGGRHAGDGTKATAHHEMGTTPRQAEPPVRSADDLHRGADSWNVRTVTAGAMLAPGRSADATDETHRKEATP